eukprot:11224079-Lingulodinium_polyedra.AAC.1
MWASRRTASSLFACLSVWPATKRASSLLCQGSSCAEQTPRQQGSPATRLSPPVGPLWTWRSPPSRSGPPSTA